MTGIFHRGGPVIDTPDSQPSDPAVCPQPWTSASTPFCTIQEWIRQERAAASLPAMAPGDTLPIVYVSRTDPAPAGRLEFDTFQGNSDLRVAQATLGAAQTIASVDAGGSQSLIGGCNLGASPDVQAPDVALDGKTVAFAGRATASDPLEIYTVDISGTNCKQITAPVPDVGGLKVHNFDPAWSPDGTYIVFASTRGTSAPTLSRRRFLPQSDIWRVEIATGNVDQMTFLSNSEISPQFMREGRVTMTTEKASDGFYQLSGRRINWDITDYHPLLGQRKSSPYADPTDPDPTKTNPSIGYDSVTDIREGNDGSFLIILSDLNMDGTPVAKGGAGALATFNRSVGPFEQGRADLGYVPSLLTFDASGGTANGRAGATAGYRAPFYMPDGSYMVSFTQNPQNPTWDVVDVTPGRPNNIPPIPPTQRVLIPNASDAVLAYPVPGAHAVLEPPAARVRRQQRADERHAHATLHMPDAPMVFTLLTGNLRRGRPVDAFRKATMLKVLAEGACPARSAAPTRRAACSRCARCSAPPTSRPTARCACRSRRKARASSSSSTTAPGTRS